MARKNLLNIYNFTILSAFHLFISCNTKAKETDHPILQTEEPALKIDTTKNTPQTLDTIDIRRIKAIDLTSEYIANEVKADIDYKGKAIIVTGIITDIKKGIGDDIYVVLKGSEKSRSVQCYYADEKAAKDLKKGMEVSFKGKCDGLWVNVIVSNCIKLSNLTD